MSNPTEQELADAGLLLHREGPVATITLPGGIPAFEAGRSPTTPIT